MSLSQTAKEKLAAVSTATLTTVLFKRGFRNTFIQGIHRINPGRPMVGPAYTLRYIPAREDLDHLGVFEDRSHPQRKGVEECPAGAVFVIDSRRNSIAASAGGILLTRLWKRGVEGIVTDGGFRDTPEIARMADFPAYHSHPAAPTNLIHHHAVDLNVPIACGEVAVYSGDIIVGDGEGVAVIPAHIADEVATEAFEQTAFEDFVQEQVEGGKSIFGIYPPSPETRAEFQTWRKSKGR